MTWFRTTLVAVCVLAPRVLISVMVCLYGITAPFSDQWFLLGELKRMYAGVSRSLICGHGTTSIGFSSRGSSC